MGDSGSYFQLVDRNRQKTNKLNPYYSAATYYPLPSIFSTYRVVSSTETSISSGSAADAVIQAGGQVSIDAKSSLANGVVKSNIAHVDGQVRQGETATISRVNTTAIHLNPQLPPELQQRAVNPVALPDFNLPQGENGLFRLSDQSGQSGSGFGTVLPSTGEQHLARAGELPVTSRPATAHRYLIETNPALTDLKQFMSSDYLLGNLGYDTDAAQKRLGDGLYEQRLIREAIVARTGQRYLAGLTSDEAMFRYLMDNALASKNALGLSLGVTLTAEQVAALTHDIVWMEEHEVLGEKVLVPVLYLAQAEGRLAPNGALIQGRDVALISGGDLTNQGTLRASRNLDITAGAITNSGLMQANERLQLLATDSIRNTAGGIIAGRDVSAVALTGDIINERSVTRHDVRFGSQHNIRDFVDSAARIEAANDLSISAGRDVADRGGVLESRGDLVIDAARDVTLTSVEERVSQARGNHYLNEKVTQLGAQVSAGGDIDISAGRDLAVIASQIDAGRDLALNAGGDVLLTSAANEDHFYSRSKKVTRSTDKIVQQSSVVQAGRDIAIAAGEDLTLVASQVKAGNNVALDAEQDINILSAKDESASFYSKKKKGSFGRSSSKQQESYHSTNIASVIEAGNDLTINTSKTEGGGLSIDGGRDVTVIGSQLSAGNDLLVGATGDVAILSGVEEHGSYSKKTKSGFLGMSKSGKSQLKTSATQVASELDAGNDVVIAAGNDIRLRASEAIASNDVELRAGLVTETGDINLVSANDEAYSRSEEYKKKVGLSFSDAAGLAVGTPGFGGDITLASAKKAGREAISSTIVGSQVIADRDATLAAERDINIVGSGVSAGRNVLLDAGRDVNVVAGTERMQTTSWESTKTFGMQQDFDRNGYSTFIGQEALKDKQLNAQQTAAASQITAGLNLDVKAGRDVVQQGSDMSAGYDLNVQAGRNILIDSAGEQSVYERETSQSRTGTTTTVNHNFGNMIDGINGAGKGDNTVSQASGVLKAVGGVSQFLSGPTFDGHVGSTSHSQTVTQSGTGNRGSSLDAGNDVTLTAGNSVVVKGGQLQSGRDIKVSAQDIVLDVARGEQRYEHEQTQAKGGFVGGTTGGFKVGIGGSQGTATQEGSQGTASGTQLQAGRDIVLDARNDLSLIGTQAMAERDIKLNAGNDLLITAAENAQSAEERRRSGGGEVGLTFGQSGIGVYASVNIGRGELDREGGQQQEAYLYAGRNVDMKSGRDTAITGAQIEGENVTGDVGRNLTVSSVPDTGKVSGKEFDASATVTVGYGFSVSGSVGYGQTNGETNWVGNQTSITARDRLDLRTEGHTQIDGALIASNTGNLKLDTDTLGFRDIQGEDKEHSYYLNAGGSYGNGQQDQSQQGKGEAGVNGWSVNGYDYDKEREQIVRATVGAGEIVVRSDAESGKDSTAGLNRDVSKAYEVTKDEEERTDLYVSKTSVEALQNPEATVKQWANALATYDEKAKANLGEVGVGLNGTFNRLERALGRELPAGAKETGGADIAEAALEAMLLNGKSLSEAKALLADESFQKNLLVHIKDLEDISKAGGLTIALQFLDEESGEWIDAGNSKKLIPTQRVLRRLAAINSYLEDNPDAGTALAWGLAAMQGPKAVIQLAAEQALGATELGQRLAQYVEQMQYEFGKDIAETIERKDLYEQEIKDKLLIGGGTLLVDIIAGGVPVGRKAGKSEITVGAKDKYTPNAGSVADMGKFLKQPGFGSQVHPSSQKTKQIFQGQSVYQVTSPVGDYLAKGDKFYLDGMHKNHLEVFDSKGRFKAVLNLDGSYNSAKTSKAISEGRRLAK
ncbi:hemagglutinin repeat-containing protein [Stutzerimonas decontaminans]|nr:hemagglutinin repeat-containing protein [Stutzerimonas decontaminans]